MKRTRLERRTELKRKTRMKQRRGSRRRSSRVYDTAYMLRVKTLPCCAPRTPTATQCYGVVEAAHAGKKVAAFRKCDDNLTIPLCQKHHTESDHFHGTFKTWDGGMMRSWLDEMIRQTQDRLASGNEPEDNCQP